MGAMAANFDEEVPMIEGEGTRRLALLDMDWEHVRAVDILMVLRSFLAEVRLPLLRAADRYSVASLSCWCSQT